MQINLILRNSGTYEGLTAVALRRLRLIPEAPTGPADALFKLQFFARVAIQCTDLMARAWSMIAATL